MCGRGEGGGEKEEGKGGFVEEKEREISRW